MVLLGAAVSGVTARLNEKTKSSAVTGLPFDHLALSRKWKVYTLPSLDISHDLATPGTA